MSVSLNCDCFEGKVFVFTFPLRQALLVSGLAHTHYVAKNELELLILLPPPENEECTTARCLFSAEGRTQGFLYVRQELYQLNHTFSLVLLSFSENSLLSLSFQLMTTFITFHLFIP